MQTEQVRGGEGTRGGSHRDVSKFARLPSERRDAFTNMQGFQKDWFL